MMATSGEGMGERGKVRRMDSSSSGMDVEPEGEDGGIWRRGQDHFRHFAGFGAFLICRINSADDIFPAIRAARTV